MNCYESPGIIFGLLFRPNVHSSASANIKHLDSLFHRYLLMLQEEAPSLVGEDTDVVNWYSVRHSLWRGSTTQARNKKVPRNIINLNNHWRTEEAAGARATVGGEMLKVYTDVLAAIETLLQYSEPL
ncbi:hypothetical protein ACA910_012931 [Epithemia clementina (nom. ined.)]